MQSGIPLLCATDTYTDVGCIAEQNGYGLWCESNNGNAFMKQVKILCNPKTREVMGKNSKKFLDQNYTVDSTYNIIMDKLKNR